LRQNDQPRALLGEAIGNDLEHSSLGGGEFDGQPEKVSVAFRKRGSALHRPHPSEKDDESGKKDSRCAGGVSKD